MLNHRQFCTVSGDPSWVPPPHLTVNKTHLLSPRNSDITLTTGAQNIWLFNIANDPTERSELSRVHPEKVQELLERLAYYNSTAVPVKFPALDPRSNPKLHGGFWGPWE